jgi:hypothetical protein
MLGMHSSVSLTPHLPLTPKPQIPRQTLPRWLQHVASKAPSDTKPVKTTIKHVCSTPFHATLAGCRAGAL